MKITTNTFACIAMTAIAIGSPSALAKRKANANSAEITLTETGQKLANQYTAQLEALKREITEALPNIGQQKQSAYLNARQAEDEAKKVLDQTIQKSGALKRAEALVKHAKGKWIGGAEKGIAKANAKLKQAASDAERQAAEKELAKWQENLAQGKAALKERQALLDTAQKERPQVEQALQQAKDALASAKAHTQDTLKKLGITNFLSQSTLDGKLAKHLVLMEATAKGLAAFAQQSAENEQLVSQLLADEKLMLQMALADGAKKGKYGQAMKIYTAIQKASAKASTGNLQRLAVAVSITHADPIKQRNAVADTDAAEHVDPVARYLNYEKAFLNGELDPAFKDLTTWDYCMVVNGEEPDEIAAWGRQMLSNYRPDQITTSDYRWRYVTTVRTDIRYGSQDNKHDRADLHFFQNILMNGGICGRRAFYGRFILRAFGIPVIARPQPAHAALAHWTPDGWVVCLGGNWGIGWTKGRYGRDLDFLASTQARAAGEPFMMVKRAQWIGDVMDEPRVFGLLDKTTPKFWYGISLYVQRAVIQASKAKTLAAVGESLGEANESATEKEVIEEVAIASKDREISVAADGTITIPAAATSKPTKNSGRIIFINSNLGGKQLHYARTGPAGTFEYTFDAPAAGAYELTAKIVTPSWKQHLLATVNNAAEPVAIELPHTVGMWGHTQATKVTLKKGRNVISFAHKTDGYDKGFSIKEFTLKPLK